MATPSNQRDHLAWLHYWADQLARALNDATTDQNPVTAAFSLNYAVNCARIAHGRAMKAKPGLRKAKP